MSSAPDEPEKPAKKKAQVPNEDVRHTNPTAFKKRGNAELDDTPSRTSPTTTSVKQSPVQAAPMSSTRSRRPRRPNYVWQPRDIKRLLAALLVALQNGEFVDGEMKKKGGWSSVALQVTGNSLDSNICKGFWTSKIRVQPLLFHWIKRCTNFRLAAQAPL